MINVSALEDLSKKYNSNLDDVNASYKCEWDDSVHDSYKRLISELDNYNEELRRVPPKVKDIIVAADKAEKVLNNADMIIRRSESV